MASASSSSITKLKLQSSDGAVFSVDLAVARLSVTIRTMMDDLGLEGAEDAVPLPNVKGDVLKKVLEWCGKYKDTSYKSAEGYENKYELSEWDVEFFKVEQAMLFDLILAANYLDIESLLEER